jgi:predicted phosphodiesterase
MRYLILSDIHANIEALESTLAAAGECDAVLVLGDLVGYGADPNAVIARVQSFPNATIIRGNHDKVGAGIETVESFNHLARHAISWTATELTPEHRQWLAAMPAGPALVDDLVEICHGSPFDEDAYIFDDLDARRAVVSSQRSVCLYGHTHVPAIFKYDGELSSLGPPRGARHRRDLRHRVADGDRAARRLRRCRSAGQNHCRGTSRGARPTARDRAINQFPTA